MKRPLNEFAEINRTASRRRRTGKILQILHDLSRPPSLLMQKRHQLFAAASLVSGSG